MSSHFHPRSFPISTLIAFVAWPVVGAFFMSRRQQNRRLRQRRLHDCTAEKNICGMHIPLPRHYWMLATNYEFRMYCGKKVPWQRNNWPNHHHHHLHAIAGQNDWYKNFHVEMTAAGITHFHCPSNVHTELFVQSARQWNHLFRIEYSRHVSVFVGTPLKRSEAVL